jgi:hypothetical protein
MVNVMYRNPLPDYFDNALSSARIVSLIVDQIEAAPAQGQRQQQELARLNSQINSARQSLISERAAFDAERRRVTDAGDLDQTRRELEQRDVATQLEEKRGELIRVQNQIAAEGRKLEGIVKELRRLERQIGQPGRRSSRRWVMSRYRMLSPHSINGYYLSAGTIQSTADVGGLLPTNWVPDGSVEALDTPAVNAVYAAGIQPWIPQPGSLSFLVAPPQTYWRVVSQIGGGMALWQLTGLGSALAQVIGPTGPSN